jgi:biopolymer transport protein ExbD
MRGKLGKAEAGEVDVELNLTSIIDCFTVLITYLLVTASFISFGILDVSVAAPSPADSASPGSNPPLGVTVFMAPGYAMEIRTTGEETRTYPIPSKGGKWDLDAVTDHLNSFKSRFPKLDTALVSADDAIEYREVVHAVETVRSTIPNVSLGAEQAGG